MDESTRKGSGTDSADEGEGRFSRAKEYVSDKYASASDTMKNQYNRVRSAIRYAATSARIPAKHS